MGITIHFQGTLKDTDLLDSLIEELIEISDTLDWEWQTINENWSLPATAKLLVNGPTAEIVGHLPLKGIRINLHPECESLLLYFDHKGQLRTPLSLIMINEGRLEPEHAYNTVKTQYAPPDIHISIIKLLRYLKKRYIPDLYVIDEGDYWDTSDHETLIKKMTFLQDKINQVSKIISSMDMKQIHQCLSEQLVKILEKKLKKNL